MSDKRCQTCKHWRTAEVHREDEFAGMHTCGDESGATASVDFGGNTAQLWTKPTFGCVEHEVKDCK